MTEHPSGLEYAFLMFTHFPLKLSVAKGSELEAAHVLHPSGLIKFCVAQPLLI